MLQDAFLNRIFDANSASTTADVATAQEIVSSLTPNKFRLSENDTKKNRKLRVALNDFRTQLSGDYLKLPVSFSEKVSLLHVVQNISDIHKGVIDIDCINQLIPGLFVFDICESIHELVFFLQTARLSLRNAIRDENGEDVDFSSALIYAIYNVIHTEVTHGKSSNSGR